MLRELITLGAQNNETVFYTAEGKVHDRASTLSASQLGGCIRKAAYKRTGGEENEKKPDEFAGYAERGNAGEVWVVHMLRKACSIRDDVEFLYGGDDQVTLVHEGISATPDGLLVYDENMVDGVEIKTISPRAKIDEPRPKHVTQCKLQLELWNKTTQYRPSRVLLIYINSDDYSIMTEFVVERDKSIFQYALDRREYLFSSDDPEDFIAEGAFNDECDTCNFSSTCKGARLKAIPTEISDIPSQVKEELEDYCEERVQLKSELKSKESRVKEIDEKIKVLMGEIGTKKGTVGDYRISISLVAGRKTVSTELLEKDGIDVEQYMKQGNPHSRMTITGPKKY